jgi:hypothetical protein
VASQDASHLRDPLLTAKGKEQCLELQKAFPVAQDISLILASPLQRTIQTAAYAFAPELDARNVSFILTPNAQEISGMNCDIGHEVDFVRETAPKLIHEAAPSWKVENLDTTLVKKDWNSKARIILRSHFTVMSRTNPSKERDLRPHLDFRSEARSRLAKLDLESPRKGHRSRHTWRILALLD